MSISWKAVVLGGAFAFAMLGQAGANPASLLNVDKSAGAAPIVRVHGCHYDDRYSPGLGKHNHSNSDCRPEAARRDVPDYEGGRGRRGGYGGYGGYGGGGRHCHYECRYEPAYGWHNHSNSECRPERCRGR